MKDKLNFSPKALAIMGVVNVTPDSFSDGGRFFDANAAIEHELRLAEEGADILGIGGESTRLPREGYSALQSDGAVRINDG